MRLTSICLLVGAIGDVSALMAPSPMRTAALKPTKLVVRRAESESEALLAEAAALRAEADALSAEPAAPELTEEEKAVRTRCL